jgi:hypothetical protein
MLPTARLARSIVPLQLLLLLSPPARAASPLVDSSTGTQFAPTRKLGETTFQCLGAGVRKVFIVKIYALTFCLDATGAEAAVADYAGKAHSGKSGEALAEALEEDPAFFDALSSARLDKLVVMRLVHDVPAAKLAAAFRESLADVLSKDKIEKLVAAVPGDGKEGHTILLYTKGNTLTIDLEGSKKTIDDAETAQKLWRVWLGPKSVSPTLKESLAERAARK